MTTNTLTEFVKRVAYREGQVLSADDLTDEQLHRVAARRRHSIAHHGWGIAVGLELSRDSKQSLVIDAGVAIDGYGRELIVGKPQEITFEEWSAACDSTDDRGRPIVRETNNDGQRKKTAALDLWLIYARHSAAPTDPCGPDAEANEHTRWREMPGVIFTPGPDEDEDFNPRRPPSVRVEDLDFAPHRLPPDDPELPWPVFLGRLTATARGAANAEIWELDEEAIDLADRSFVTLVGESIVAPSGQAMVQIGSELDGDRRRFAVSVLKPAEEGDEQAASGQTNTQTPQFVHALTVDKRGDFTIQGDATIRGRLILGQNTAWPEEMQPPHGLQWKEPRPLPEGPSSWQIYRTTVEPENGVRKNELRIEIEHPGDQGDPSRHRFVVGTLQPDGNAPADGVGAAAGDPNGDAGQTAQTDRIMARLAIGADKNVRVIGDLTVKGQLIRGPVPADADDPRFQRLLLEKWADGIDTLIRAVNQARLAVDVHRVDATASAQVAYQLTVTNPTDAKVTGIKVVERVRFDQGTPTAERDVAEFDLLPFTSKAEPITGGPTVPAGANEVTVQITATGTTSDGETLAGADERTDQVV